jgi:hypothetical protein
MCRSEKACCILCRQPSFHLRTAIRSCRACGASAVRLDADLFLRDWRDRQGCFALSCSSTSERCPRSIWSQAAGRCRHTLCVGTRSRTFLIGQKQIVSFEIERLGITCRLLYKANSYFRIKTGLVFVRKVPFRTLSCLSEVVACSAFL